MAWTNVGFDGTITEIQWAGLSSLLGNGYVAAGNGDCKVTAVAGARSVSVAAGSLYGDGVQSTNSGAETVALTTPVNGQWYLIVLRRTWASNTAALVAVAGATTSTTIPTSPPSTYPTINTNVGVLTDQPIAWAWCNSATTDVVVSDLRQFPVRTQESTGNAIINGDFSVNQRNFSSLTGAGYGFDRWTLGSNGGTVTYSAQAFTVGNAPLAGYEASNFARLLVSGQSTTGHYAQLVQRIEDVRAFAGQTATVSFWAKAASGTPKVLPGLYQGFGSGGSTGVSNDGSPITLSTVWTRYSVTIPVASILGKTVGAGSFVQLALLVSGEGSAIGVQNNTFDFWGVQVEKGSTATQFKTATGTKQGELAACQRYYYRHTAEAPYAWFAYGTAYSNIAVQASFNLPVTMRVPASTIEYSSGTWRLQGGTDEQTGITALAFNNSVATTDTFCFDVNCNGITSFRAYRLVANNTTSAYIGVSAEL